MEEVVMSTCFFPVVNSSPVGNDVSVPFAPGLMLSKPMTHLASRTMLPGGFCAVADGRLNDGAAIAARSRAAPRTSRTRRHSGRRTGLPRVLKTPEGICTPLVFISWFLFGIGLRCSDAPDGQVEISDLDFLRVRILYLPWLGDNELPTRSPKRDRPNPAAKERQTGYRKLTGCPIPSR